MQAPSDACVDRLDEVEMNELMAICTEEVARVVLFLAAADSAGITGQNFVIDAGWV